MRANQFRHFLADVFVKMDRGDFKDKIGWDIKYTEE